jgi:signal peptidase II
VGIALIAGGAAGNLLDRLLHGGVTDFLELRAGHFRWPAFNLADSAITIGAALIIFELFSGERHASRART